MSVEGRRLTGANPSIVACIPAYNEESRIASIIISTKRHVGAVVVCDDGSGDMTGEIAECLGAVVVKHERNLGKGAALRSAFLRAKELGADVVVVLDADGQHDPEEIPKLIEPILKKEADVVVGSRYVYGSKTDAPLYRRLGLRLINSLGKRYVNSEVNDIQSGFRVFSNNALNVVLRTESTGFGVETEQLALANRESLRVVEVPVSVRYAGLGKTSKRHPVSHGIELVGIILRLVLEDRPLLLLGVPGFFLMIVGVFTGGYFLWYFNATLYFSLLLALIAFGALIIGVLLIIASFILNSMSKLRSSKLVNANVPS